MVKCSVGGGRVGVLQTVGHRSVWKQYMQFMRSANKVQKQWQTFIVENGEDRGREGGRLCRWVDPHTHPPRRTNINNYRLEIRAGLFSSGGF